jgi:hypothetical protein
MTVDEAMDEYEWDVDGVRDYFFEKYSGHEVFEMLWDRCGQERILEWALDGADFEDVVDAMEDIYSRRGAEDIILDVVADRYTVQDFLDHR